MKGNSAMTSVNKNKVPALFRDGRKYGLIKNGAKVLDYGCGRWPEVVREFLSSSGCTVVSYDPNWFPVPDGYTPDMYDSGKGGYDIVALSNVLNVIEDRAERLMAVKNAWKAVGYGGRLLVTVYPGDASGASGPSKPGCWQERRTLSSYCDPATGELSSIPGRIYFGRLWASDPKANPNDKVWPEIGTRGSLCNYYSGSMTPVTVVGKQSGKLIVRECRLIFNGPRYYNTYPDSIEEGIASVDREHELSWSPKGACWKERGTYGRRLELRGWKFEPNVN